MRAIIIPQFKILIMPFLSDCLYRCHGNIDFFFKIAIIRNFSLSPVSGRLDEGKSTEKSLKNLRYMALKKNVSKHLNFEKIVRDFIKSFITKNG